MSDIAERLGRIEGKQDLMLDIMKEDRKRLSLVEKKVWYGSGVAAVLAYVAAKVTMGGFA